jgi:hypothetical protein
VPDLGEDRSWWPSSTHSPKLASAAATSASPDERRVRDRLRSSGPVRDQRPHPSRYARHNPNRLPLPWRCGPGLALYPRLCLPASWGESAVTDSGADRIGHPWRPDLRLPHQTFRRPRQLTGGAALSRAASPCGPATSGTPSVHQ